MDCVFCRIVAGREPAHIVYEDEKTLAFLDHLPIQEGHTLVIPKKHARDAWDIEPEQAAAVMRTALKVARALKTAYDCDGVNLFQSSGSAAGQTVFHFHMHVVPRWRGRRVFLLQRGYPSDTVPFGQVAERIRDAMEMGRNT